MNINHRNVVRFLGFCSNTHHIMMRKEAGETSLVNVRERLLCFEYVSNGSLDRHITDELRGLEWEPRYDIISGICKGLFYLHKEKRIVHMDLKPPNILLDDHMVPKITDFGLSRSNEMSHTTGQRFGTLGYVSPEYQKDGKTSFKCDIYSLGVIITELVTGRKSVPHKNNARVVRRWRHRWKKPPTSLQYQQVTRCIEIAERCRQQEPEARPSIGDIISILSESGSSDGHTGQGSTYLDDDMLGIEPLELKFDEEMSWSVKLTNKTNACFAFSIERPSKQYTIQPDEGILTPGCSECLVQIAVTSPQVAQNADKLIVRSTKVNEGLRVEDITKDIFHEVAGKVIDEVDLMLVYETVEAASSTRKAINSGSYKDSARGQLDRRNFHRPEHFSRSQPANMTPHMDVTSVNEDVNSLSKELVKMQRKVGQRRPVLQLIHNSEQIRDKLLQAQGLLHSAQGSHNPGLQRLLEKLSRDADQAEDLLDEVHYFQIHDRLHGTSYATTQDGSDDDDAVASAPRRVTNSASADGDTLHFDIVSMSSKIKSLLQGMESHCDSVSNLLGIGSILSNSTAVVILRPQTASMIIQDTLYGRRHIFEETVNRITDTDATQTVSVLPIVGPGGIGKTTFAQHLYNDDRTKKRFDVSVWVCVSTDFDVLKLTREILACIVATEGESSGVANETTNLNQLQKSIVHRLKSKRFLIVLDDIWKCDSQDMWKTLLAPFAKGETKGSMLLVTTRFPKLAQMMETVGFGSLKLSALKPNEFIKLFEACIFGEENKPENYEAELAVIARKIANKLKGSPLAAKTVGRLLNKDLSQKHWNGVLEKHQWLKQQNNDDIMPSLKISYDCLPFDLKKCFSYCGLFPEDHWFTSSEISHFWVAIGIIDSNHQADRNHLQELVDNGFLMKELDNRRGQYYYVMHDLMHELSKSVSVQECLNISGLDFRAHAIPQSVRHLSINIEDRYDANFEEEMCKLRERIDIANLRSLMIFRDYVEERIAKILKDSFKEINSLRVLFIVVKSAQSFPCRFSKLIHLQYLKITSSYYSDREMSLPSPLSRFYHLKFLDLGRWCGRSDLPEDFSHLENLHDFRAESELHSNIRNVGKMKRLQELKEFHVKKESMGFELTELGALPELEGGLTVRGLEHVATKEEATTAKLALKRNLKELELLWGRDGPTTDAEILASYFNQTELELLWGRDVPTADVDILDADILDALQPHSNLRVLTIANHGGTIGPSWLCLDIWLTSLERLAIEGVSWSTLPPFGKLPNLKDLNLRRISGMHQFGLRCGGAPGECSMRLKEVGFYEMPELAEWAVEPNCHSLTSIEEIICIDCPNLRVMPLSEVSCTNLCTLQVSWCPKMSLPSMPHTSTLTNLDVKRDDLETLLSYHGKELVVGGYGGALAYHNLDKVEVMTVGRCDSLFSEELDGSIVFRSVKSLKLDASHLTSSKSSSSKVLNCFPSLSVLEIVGNEQCVMQFPSSSSLQKLTFSGCRGLVLVPVENGGGIQEDNSLLQSLTILRCDKLFCRWPMGESETIFPFPASLRELHVEEELSMKSMALLSNLMSLTSLKLNYCSNLTVDGFNSLIAVNLIVLVVYNCSTLAADMLSEVVSQRAKLLPAGYISRLEVLRVDDICGLLVAPICNLLAPALHTLEFCSLGRMESFMEEQEKALQLLSSLQKLCFLWCEGLQSLPQGLHHLSSLKELQVIECPKIQWMPKEGLPVSLRKLEMNCRSAEIDEQIEKIKRTNPDLSVSDEYTQDY
ncbi:putative disease resistance protein RGA4 isoform X2 [Triticum dicoccoides]|nr:putative disease resistance protein RGA4 isoform X2 [Triticum dicoccoides]